MNGGWFPGDFGGMQCMVSKEQGSFSFREADTGSREAVEQLKARQGRVVM